MIEQRQGRDREAEAQWRALLAEQPGFAGAWEGLAELALRRGRWEQVEECAARLEELPEGALEAAVFRARVRLGRRELAAARDMLEETIRCHPRTVKPRLMHSRVLLQAGDDAAAGAALQAVLELDGENPEARHNLRVLYGDPEPRAPVGRGADGERLVVRAGAMQSILPRPSGREVEGAGLCVRAGAMQSISLTPNPTGG